MLNQTTASKYSRQSAPQYEANFGFGTLVPFNVCAAANPRQCLVGRDIAIVAGANASAVACMRVRDTSTKAMLAARAKERLDLADVEEHQVGCLQMKRLARWFRTFFRRRQRPVSDDDLPFTTEEFARLIASGRSEDMQILARGLSRPNPSSRIELESS
ncbi:hypothetical protein V1291_005334 [Nitrobacteraceae bacterium AZCC 1564]